MPGQLTLFLTVRAIRMWKYDPELGKIVHEKRWQGYQNTRHFDDIRHAAALLKPYPRAPSATQVGLIR